jgi:puromycin-sensitive aminopeptidase
MFQNQKGTREIVSLFLFSFSAITNTMKTPAKKPSTKKPNVRLSPQVVPTRYDLHLKPDLEAHTFEGQETIHLVLAKPTKTLVMHSKDLDIASGSVSFGKTTMYASAIGLDGEKETVTYIFDKAIPKGKATLTTHFAGILTDSMRGLYKSTYFVDGKEHTMATTQFEATDARRAFPCFDEPAQKAVFHVSLEIPTGKTAISNMLPTEIVEHESGYKVVSFAPTPKMSTYLLAFLVGDFEYLEAKTKRGVLVRVYTTPGKKHQAHFSLDVAVKCLEFYEDYFGIDYPLNTLDMIAIPDFASAAMENWGAVTYRETALLVDPENTSGAVRQRVAIVIAHELAHQWFGNLVTMEWWTHLWLNEGFASYMEYLAVDHLFPEWNIWSHFVAEDHNDALSLDSLSNTHPIEIEVHHPSEITEIFDEVSYSKGASVIRMLASYIGPKAFQKGLQQYLKKHSYKNTSTIHLWEAFEQASKKPIRKMMEGWTKKGGYPVISAELNNEKLTLSQERFFARKPKGHAGKETWMTPIMMRGDREETNTVLLASNKTVVPKPKDSWFTLNASEAGFYRSRYDGALIGLLHGALENGRVPAIERAGIVRDYRAFAEAGYVPTTELLDVLRFYTDERDYTARGMAIGALGGVSSLVFGTPAHELLKAFGREFLKAHVADVGFEPKTGENHEDTLSRSLVLASAVAFNDTAVVAHAQKLFAQRDTVAINPDLRGFVYNAVAANGNAKTWNTFVEMYKKAELQEEKNRVGRALTRFKDEVILKKTLEFALSKHVRSQDAPLFLAGVTINNYGKYIAWEFVKKNWTEIVRRYGSGGGLLSRYIVKVLESHTDMKIHKDIRAFFKKNPTPQIVRSVEQVLEAIETNALWKKQDEKKVGKWLENYFR